MTDQTELDKLASLSEEEKAKLLQWYRETPESEAELIAYTHTPGRSGKRVMSEAMLTELHAFLTSITGPDSPYQFAGLSHLYNAYRRMQDKHDEYCQYMGRDEFKFFMRRWFLKHNLDWEEKSDTRRNKVRFIFPNGFVSNQYSGFGRKKLHFYDDGQKILTVRCIQLDTVWNGSAFYNDQVIDDTPRANV
jgi:hypothetical protein